jgi:UDP-glucose 4-epimerase
MQILITGGAGYIGSHVAKLLLENSACSLTILDNLSTGFIETIDELARIAKENEKEFAFIEADLSNYDEVKRIFDAHSFDAIIHFAAALVVPESVQNPLKYYLNNTANTSNLVKEAIEHNVNKFIFSSTAAVYGEPDNLINEDGTFEGIKEDFTPSPVNPYGYSKLFSEQVIKDSAKANEAFNYVILRYFNVAGADGRIGQSTKNATHLIKVASQTAHGKREKMYIFGDDYNTKDGTCVRDYIHVNDLASAHIKALEFIDTPAYSELDEAIFNVGYGDGYSVQEVLDTMKEVTNTDFRVDMSPRRAGDPALLVANSNKLKTLTGWQPHFEDLKIICQSAFAWEAKVQGL